MTVNKQPSLGEILNLLRRLDACAVNSEGITTRFLEVKSENDRREVCVNGNVAGLVYLANLVLTVAERGFVGAHQHLDEAGGLDTCDVPLVISFKLAEWDKQE